MTEHHDRFPDRGRRGELEWGAEVLVDPEDGEIGVAVDRDDLRVDPVLARGGTHRDAPAALDHVKGGRHVVAVREEEAAAVAVDGSDAQDRRAGVGVDRALPAGRRGGVGGGLVGAGGPGEERGEGGEERRGDGEAKAGRVHRLGNEPTGESLHLRVLTRAFSGASGRRP